MQRRQAELDRSREQLRALAQHVNTAREVERARLARDVYDVLGGMLTSVKMDLTRIVRRVGTPELQPLHGILSVKTVGSHRASILDKLGVFSNAELVQYAMRHGLLD